MLARPIRCIARASTTLKSVNGIQGSTKTTENCKGGVGYARSVMSRTKREQYRLGIIRSYMTSKHLRGFSTPGSPYHVEDANWLMHPKIVVVGVGGCGGNAVDNMIARNLTGVEFVIANTDAQALKRSKTHHKVQLGKGLTKGLGAGSSPATGRAAAEESIKEIMDIIGDSQMVFLTAGMGGGTGTGAAPVIAEACRKRGILTVAIVTTPFEHEGTRRHAHSLDGIQRLHQQVDSIITVANQKLMHNSKCTYLDAYQIVNDILYQGVQGVTDLIVRPGLINLDFADVHTIVSGAGRALIGTGEAEGEGRGLRAAEAALFHPLLDDVDISGAKSVLINVTGGSDLGLFEINEISQLIAEQADPDANVIFGTTLSDTMNGRVRVSIFVTALTDNTFETLAKPVVNTKRLHQQHHDNQHQSVPDTQSPQPQHQQQQQQPQVSEQPEQAKSKMGWLREWF